MAVIRETFTLEDQMTNVMTQMIQVAERMSGALDDIRYSTMNVETATASAAVEMQNMSDRMSQTTTQGTSLLTTVRNLAGAFLGMQSVRWLVGTSDQLTQIDARLQMITGSAEAAAEANEQIYQAAMRSRGAYANMANFVSQLGLTAGNAFDDLGELVAFAEQIQKQMTISGSGGQSAAAALVQLTQGLSSGTLRGEELNSVLEQTPMIAKTIADYMGVTTGEMRELASEGAVTADVVKNAILGAAEETNAAFEQMPMTWGQVWTSFQNIAIKALQPVLAGISFLANNIEIIGPLVLGLGGAFAVFLLAANWVNICTGATAALTTAQEMLRTAMATAWALPLIIIALVLGAIYAVTAAVNHFAGTSVSATGIITGLVATAAGFVINVISAALNVVLEVFSLIWNAVAMVANFVANVFIHPIKAVARLFAGLADTVLGVLEVIATAIDTIFGSNLSSAVSGWRSGLDNLVNEHFGGVITVMEKLDPGHFGRLNYSDMFQAGYNWGANLFSSGGAGSGNPYAYAPYDELTAQLGGIGESVKGIEKSVNMSDEDIKALVDIAERRYVNNINLTAQTPVINITGQNTGNTAADRQNLANTIRDILVEQVAAGSVISTARAY